jgi:hypothetical protein
MTGDISSSEDLIKVREKVLQGKSQIRAFLLHLVSFASIGGYEFTHADDVRFIRYFWNRVEQVRYVTHHLWSTFHTDDLPSHRARYGTYHFRSIDLVTTSFCSNASENSQIHTWRGNRRFGG